MDAVADAGVDIDLFSLFPPTGSVVHPAAERWLPALRQGRLGGGMAGLDGGLAASGAGALQPRGDRPRLLATARARRPGLGDVRDRVRPRPVPGGANVTHIHAHYATYPALAAWLCWRLTALPYSFTAHAHDLFVDQSMLARKVRDAGFVVAISEFNRRFLAASRCRARRHRGPRGPLRNRSRRLRIPTALRAAGGPGRCSVRRQPSGVQGPRGSAHGPRHRAGLERLHLDLVGDGELGHTSSGSRRDWASRRGYDSQAD